MIEAVVCRCAVSQGGASKSAYYIRRLRSPSTGTRGTSDAIDARPRREVPGVLPRARVHVVQCDTAPSILLKTELTRRSGGTTLPASLSIVTADHMDLVSARWVRELTAGGVEGDKAVARLRELLLRASWSELNRRAARSGLRGVDLDDMANQAANDATVSVLAKIASFRGDSRFSTWAYKFAIFEVSGKLGRHIAQQGVGSSDDLQWETLPQRLAPAPADAAVASQLLGGGTTGGRNAVN